MTIVTQAYLRNTNIWEDRHPYDHCHTNLRSTNTWDDRHPYWPLSQKAKKYNQRTTRELSFRFLLWYLLLINVLRYYQIMLGVIILFVEIYIVTPCLV